MVPTLSMQYEVLVGLKKGKTKERSNEWMEPKELQVGGDVWLEVIDVVCRSKDWRGLLWALS